MLCLAVFGMHVTPVQVKEHHLGCKKNKISISSYFQHCFSGLEVEMNGVATGRLEKRLRCACRAPRRPRIFDRVMESWNLER